MTAVHQFVEGFNKGDTKMLSSACADGVSIIDEFPPHEAHHRVGVGETLGDHAEVLDVGDGEA